MLKSMSPLFYLTLFTKSLRYIPIIASVSEHQPTAWPSFFMDLHILIFIFPAGVFLCFKELRDEHIFVIIYAVMASYFAGVMVRLMLTLTPVVCVSAAVAVSQLLDTFLDPKVPDVNEDVESERTEPVSSTPVNNAPAAPSKKGKKAAPPPPEKLTDTISNITGASALVADSKSKGIFDMWPRVAVVAQTVYLLLFFVQHCTWVTSNAYSSPSVVLASRNPDGSNHIIDDFREAYYWLRMNTKEDEVVASWWDYGYQIAGMADRPTMVDNNTWNNSE